MNREQCYRTRSNVSACSGRSAQTNAAKQRDKEVRLQTAISCIALHHLPVHSQSRHKGGDLTVPRVGKGAGRKTASDCLAGQEISLFVCVSSFFFTISLRVCLACSCSMANPSLVKDLVELVGSSNGPGTGAAGSVQAHTLPSNDAVLAALHQRYKADLCYTLCGPSQLVVVNPLQISQDLGDASARDYEKSASWDQLVVAASPSTSSPKQSPTGKDSAGPSKVAIQEQRPHPYEFAARVFSSLQRSGKSQAIVLRWAIIYIPLDIARADYLASLPAACLALAKHTPRIS